MYEKDTQASSTRTLTAPEAGLALPPAGRERPVGLGLAGRPDGAVGTAASDAAVFAGGTYLAAGLLTVAGLIQKGLLGPLSSGLWALMQTFWTFFTLATLGVKEGATRQIPLHRGRGDFTTAASVSNTAGTFSLAATAAAGAILATVAIVAGGGWRPELRFGLVLLGLTAPLRLFTDVHQTLLGSLKQFKVLSLTVVVKAVVALTAQTLAVVAFGFYGMFLGVVMIELVALGLWARVGLIGLHRPAFHLQFERQRLRELIAFGIPLLVWGQIWLMFMAVDSLVVAGALGLETLGYYALAVSVTNQILLLPKSIGAALFPRMTEEFARTNSLSSILHYATDTQRLLAYMLVPAAIGAAFCLVPVLIRHALPAFEPAVEAVQVIVAASFFVALMNMPIKMLFTAGYRWSLTALVTLCLVINFALTYVAIVPLDLGLRGAAGATAVSYLVAFVMTTGFALSRIMRTAEVARHLGEIFVVFAWTIAALWAGQILLGDGEGLLADAALGLAKLALFAVLMLPWVVRAEKQCKGVTRLVELARDARGSLRGRAK